MDNDENYRKNKMKDHIYKQSHALPFMAFSRTDAISANKEPMRVSLKNKI